MDVSRWPLITICCSFSCFATCVMPIKDNVQVQTWSRGPGRQFTVVPATDSPPQHPNDSGEGSFKTATKTSDEKV